jgi:hypothetical protein
MSRRLLSVCIKPRASDAVMAATRVTRLVDLNLTRNALGVDHAIIVELKSLCRASDEAIFALFQVQFSTDNRKC